MKYHLPHPRNSYLVFTVAPFLCKFSARWALLITVTGMSLKERIINVSMNAINRVGMYKFHGF